MVEAMGLVTYGLLSLSQCGCEMAVDPLLAMAANQEYWTVGNIHFISVE